MQLEFDFQTIGSALPDPCLDEAALDYLFKQTQADLGSAIERKLGDMTCAEHEQPPAVIVRAVYDHETEQMEISYGVDTCCQPFLLRVVQVLHHIG